MTLTEKQKRLLNIRFPALTDEELEHFLHMVEGMVIKSFGGAAEENHSADVTTAKLKYPAKVMSKKDLMALGFPEAMLLRASQEKDQTFAWRMNPINKHSPLLFDTAGFDGWRMKQVRLQNQMSKMQKITNYYNH